MALTYGFFNSIDGDRKYNAEQFGSIFEGVIKDGVYKDVGDAFVVTATSGNEVQVGTGRGWFRNTWVKNDKPITLPLSPPDSVLPRYDYIAIRNDSSVGGRKNTIVILQGNPATTPQAPTLTDTTNIKDYPIARVLRPGGATSITSGDISSLAGSTQTPWVTSVLENVSVSHLFTQWEAEFDDWLSNVAAQEGIWRDEQLDQDGAWREEQTAEFISWRNSVQAILSEDVAGNLTAEIEQLKAQTETAYHVFDGVPEMHGQIFRGKNLGSSYSTAQKAAVRNGSFTDLWLGDYWLIGGVKYRIADFNYFLGTGTNPVTENHLIVVPDQPMGASDKYHSTATIKTYVNASIRGSLSSRAITLISAFSDANLLPIQHNLIAGFPEDGSVTTMRVTSKLELMTQEQVLGTSTHNSRNAPQPMRHFSLFRVAPKYIVANASISDRDYYLQNISNTHKPFYINSYGEAIETINATTSRSIRPFFALR